MTSSPTRPSLIFSCLPPPTPPLFFPLAFTHPSPLFFLLPSPTHPSPLFFPLALPTIPEPLPTLSEDFPKILSTNQKPGFCDVIFGKLGLKGPMRQHNEILGLFLDLMSLLSRPTIFNNQSEVSIFPRFFRRFCRMFSTNQKPGNL